MAPSLDFRHVVSMTTPMGLYEHALLTEPRVEHGMCVDDVARALVVTARVEEPDREIARLTGIYLDFLLGAQHDDGLMHNRRNQDGTWADEASSKDHWGRALWAFGVAATCLADPVAASHARRGAATALKARSRWPRSMAYASLGASHLLDADPDDSDSRKLLRDARHVIRRVRMDKSWPWPEDTLTYANAVLPEAMLVLGRHLEASDLRDDGRYLLRWLIDQQTVDGHLSPVPTSGRHRGRPAVVGFDQQPIEVAAIAEACRTAFVETRDPRWPSVVECCVQWFEGDNDAGLRMYDPVTGGGYDGLEDGSVNQNQGAESTLAWLSTVQVSMLDRAGVGR
jgi:hypothetical protein